MRRRRSGPEACSCGAIRGVLCPSVLFWCADNHRRAARRARTGSLQETPGPKPLEGLRLVETLVTAQQIQGTAAAASLEVAPAAGALAADLPPAPCAEVTVCRL